MFNLYCFWTGNNPMNYRRCAALASLKNTGANVILVTPANLNDYIIEPLHAGYKYLSETHKADYLRCYFMHFYGGGYVDVKTVSHEWISSYTSLMTDESKWAIGYREVGPDGVANIQIKNDADRKLDYELHSNWFKLIGNGAYIFKPNTPFTNEWYSQLCSKMDSNLDLLQRYPSKHPRQVKNGIFGISSEDYNYPFCWSEILGDIFHPLCLKYNEHLLYDLPLY